MDLGVLERSPDAGDPRAIDDLIAGYTSRAERFAERAVVVRAAGDALLAASEGHWVHALRECSHRLAAGNDDAAHGCRQVAHVLAGYATALRDLARRAGSARDDVEDARVRALAARRRYEAAVVAAGGRGTEVPWSWAAPPPSTAHPQAAGELRAWRAAVAAVEHGLRTFRDCCRQREDLDRDTAARLVGIDVMTAYAPGTGVDAVVDVPLVRALAATAVGTLTAEQRRRLESWFVDAVREATDHPRDPEVIRVLEGFLAAWYDDVELMAGVFAAIGGERTVRLLLELATALRTGEHPHNDAIARLAEHISTGLARGSHGWTRDTAEEFAVGLLTPEHHERGAASIIGYLFHGTTDQSVTFVVAVADELDRIEQATGRLLQWGNEPGHWLLRAGNRGSDAVSLDPGVGVLTAMARHPQVAREWFGLSGLDWSDPRASVESARLDHWFGGRNWSLPSSDGFATLADVWRALQRDTGDPFHVAVVDDAVFERLARNTSLHVTESVSAEGSRRLAEILDPLMPTLVEVGGVRDPAEEDGVWEMVPTPFGPDMLLASGVTREELVPILAAATSRSEGRVLVMEAMADYEVRALQLTANGEASPDQVLTRLAVVWGLADGVVTGATRAELQRIADRLHDQLGMARLPVDAALGYALNPFLSVAVGVAENQLQEMAVEYLRPDMAPPESLRKGGEEPMADFFTGAVERYRAAGLWDQPPVRDEFADALDGTEGLVFVRHYEDVSSSVQDHLLRLADDVPRNGGA